MTDPVRIDIPQAGLYQVRLFKGAVFVAVRIWYGAPPDPDNPGELLDRSHRWMAERDGQPIDVFRVWPDCSNKRITEAEYRFLLARADHAEKYEPDSPFADPRRPVDLMKTKPPVF